MADTIIDGTGEELPGRRILSGTDLEIAYNLLEDDLVLRVNKAGVQVFGVVLQTLPKVMTAEQLKAGGFDVQVLLRSQHLRAGLTHCA